MPVSSKPTRNAHGAFPDEETLQWEPAGRKTRAVREYLEALDNDSEGVKAHESTRKAISFTDPATCWTSAPGGPAFFGYSTNYFGS